MPIPGMSPFLDVGSLLGKRASAVAVLLSTSFLGSLLALVLVGRNPLVGPTGEPARTESLSQEVEGRPMTVPPSFPSPAVSLAPPAPDTSEAVLPASEAAPPASTTDTDPPTDERPGAGGDEEGDVEPAPPTPEPAPAVEGDVVVSKVAPSTDGEAGKAEKAEKAKGSSNKKTEGGDEESVGSSSEGGSPGGSKEDKGSAKPPKEAKVTGSGKGTKEPKGSGNGASEAPGNGKGKP
jgi:hypothetical protein